MREADRASLPGSPLLQVEPDLRVVGFPNIFALGDINDVKEEKLGYLATLQVGAGGLGERGITEIWWTGPTPP